MQLAPERVTCAILGMVRLGVGVGSSADVLEFRSCQRQLVRRQGAGARCLTRSKKKDGDKYRENG